MQQQHTMEMEEGIGGRCPSPTKEESEAWKRMRRGNKWQDEWESKGSRGDVWLHC
jgi:hypothetical protein